MKKKILIVLACLVAIAGVLCGIYFPDSEINNVIDEVKTSIVKEIVVSEETEERAIQTLEAINSDEDISTTEVIQSSEEEENNLEEEQLETDAVIEQENISYDGDSTGSGLSLLGAYQGLTYYSQADSRWANIMYSSIGNTSQTMKSSACGPTSAAMVVSSSKGAILPTTMASLFVDNGYRTSNNGTAWAAFPFVADYFDFDEYYTTSNFNIAMNYLRTDADNDGNADYYIICSCGSGLFTTGGHYIVLVADNDGTITVYDPYLYSGKFTTASRKNANVVVSGNSVFVSETSFQTYANYKYFWIFSNDNGDGNTSATTDTTNTVSYTRYVATQSANLNVRDNPNGNKISSLAKGTKVAVTEVNGDWSKISSPTSGWVSSSYLSSSVVTVQNNTVVDTTGQTKKINACYLYSNSNLTGTKYTYKANTTIKILKNISSTVDYVQVVQTRKKSLYK